MSLSSIDMEKAKALQLAREQSRAVRGQVHGMAMIAQAAFKAAGWTWGHTNGHVPSVDEVEEWLWRELLNLRKVAEKHGGWRTASGRIFAEDDGDGDARLLIDLGSIEGLLAGLPSVRAEGVA